MRVRAISTIGFLIAATLIGPPLRAGADEFAVSDPDDIDPAGIVDLRSASMGHGRDTDIVATISTFGRLSPGDLDPDQAVIGFAFSTDQNFDDVEQVAFVFGRGSRFHGVMATANGTFLATFRVSHPNPKTVRLVFDRRLVDEGSYFWFAFADTEGEGRCCFDAVPNRRWVIHDYRAPAINSVTTDAVSGQTVSDSQVPVSFNVKDSGIGLAEWRVHARPTGSEAWGIADRGTRDGARTAIVPMTQGGIFDVCVAGVDFAGNVNAENLIRVKVPLDDAAPELAYGAGWSTSGAQGTDFMGTRHVTTTVGATISFFVPQGTKADLVFPGGGIDGVALVRINGVDATTINLAVGLPLPRITLPIADPFWLTQPMNEVVIEVTGGSFVVDGVLLAPEVLPELEGRCGLHATSSRERTLPQRLPRPPTVALPQAGGTEADAGGRFTKS